MADVYIVGAGMTPLGKHLDKSVKQLTAQSVAQALADAGTDIRAVQAAWFCNTRQGALDFPLGAEMGALNLPQQDGRPSPNPTHGQMMTRRQGEWWARTVA